MDGAQVVRPRFSDKDAYEPPKFRVKDRANWWTRNNEGEILYLLTAGHARSAEGLGERGRTAAPQCER